MTMSLEEYRKPPKGVRYKVAFTMLVQNSSFAARGCCFKQVYDAESDAAQIFAKDGSSVRLLDCQVGF